MAHWIHRKHIFRRDDYICSNCGYRAKKPFVDCPHCDEPMEGGKYDPLWVDEIEEIDEILGDEG